MYFHLTFNPRCFPRALFRGNTRLDASKSCVRPVLPWETKQMNSSQVILKIMPLLYRNKMTSWKIGYLDTKIRRVLHTKKTTRYPGCLLAFFVHYFFGPLCHRHYVRSCQRHTGHCASYHAFSFWFYLLPDNKYGKVSFFPWSTL